MNLEKLSEAEFSDEVERRIDRVDTVWKAVREAFGFHLEHLADRQPPTTAKEHHSLWAEMEASEASLEEAWHELSRRKDIRLGR